METGAVTGYIDVAQIVLYVFWAFFAGLLIYLQRESRREGYPLVSEVDGKPMDHGIWMPGPKTFLLDDGTSVTVPVREKDYNDVALRPSMGWPGSPFVPTGDAMADGVGPGSYAPRLNRPDLTCDGHARLSPLSATPGFWLEERDPDPRGMTVIGADGEAAGTIVDIWLDRAEYVARYFEVELEAAPVRRNPANGDLESGSVGGHRVLLPVNFSQINAANRTVRVVSILASQFAGVPTLANPGIITLAEEDRICGYYGGGYLYATAARQESVL